VCFFKKKELHGERKVQEKETVTEPLEINKKIINALLMKTLCAHIVFVFLRNSVYDLMNYQIN